jgi:hypothetical protein
LRGLRTRSRGTTARGRSGATKSLSELAAAIPEQSRLQGRDVSRSVRLMALSDDRRPALGRPAACIVDPLTWLGRPPLFGDACSSSSFSRTDSWRETAISSSNGCRSRFRKSCGELPGCGIGGRGWNWCAAEPEGWEVGDVSSGELVPQFAEEDAAEGEERSERSSPSAFPVRRDGAGRGCGLPLRERQRTWVPSAASSPCTLTTSATGASVCRRSVEASCSSFWRSTQRTRSGGGASISRAHPCDQFSH